ncbi:DNA mismatch repair endonuclease MutL [Candidatus Berkiella aquae]|uniref:DNA mismatch repair protein MutL n=1 Tax=Candidatus Berkiella aquae TaxID=295108 RepID=A0A0Q9YVB3_9GAMM|nr:DNA mismatch repair endonuclease MutL [Candidatus Berkiella aquae]MCS5710170.1 DNA mismatch repair endonuclease MutL [Candidatus Berkiella aquae]
MMKRISQLSSVLANQIAAGEVVEKPASVVKELVENSLDANSTLIEIDIEGGGIHLIRVRDNGEGIVKEDLSLAFARHATSKISSVVDLNAIVTLGFRGEALASVASISRCRLSSKAYGKEEAWQIQLSGDMTPIIHPVAHTQGTTVEIADLFYNTPVRRKFIRSEKSEFQAIDDTVKRLALSYPTVTFRLAHQGRQCRHYPGVSTLTKEASRIEKICGQTFINHALKIELEAHGLGLRGWLGKPELLKRQADCQYFFVNQRMVKDRLLNHVIKTLYLQQLGLDEGTHPSYVLYLTIEPSEVDVNVHPTKQEVRFSQPRHVHDFIAKAISDALGHPVQTNLLTKTQAPRKRQIPESFARKDLKEIAIYPQQMISKARRYAFIEDEEGVLVCDLIKGKNSLLAIYFSELWDNVPSQPLLFPLTIPLANDIQFESSYLSLFAALGYQLKIQDHALSLFIAPRITQPNSELILQMLGQMQLKQNKMNLCEYLAKQLSIQSLYTMDHDRFSWLLRRWIEMNPKGAWRRFSYDEFAQLIELPFNT